MDRPHRTRRVTLEDSIGTRAEADSVLRYVRNPSTWSKWQSEIKGARGPDPLEAGQVVEGEARLLGFDVHGRSSATRVEETLFEEDVIVGVRMRITYTAVPASGGSVIVHRMEADLPRGVAGTVLSLFLGRRLKRMQRKLLAALRDQVEGLPS